MLARAKSSLSDGDALLMHFAYARYRSGDTQQQALKNQCLVSVDESCLTTKIPIVDLSYLALHHEVRIPLILPVKPFHPSVEDILRDCYEARLCAICNSIQ